MCIADDEHDRELQPLGVVQGHRRYRAVPSPGLRNTNPRRCGLATNRRWSAPESESGSQRHVHRPVGGDPRQAAVEAARIVVHCKAGRLHRRHRRDAPTPPGASHLGVRLAHSPVGPDRVEGCGSPAPSKAIVLDPEPAVPKVASTTPAEPSRPRYCAATAAEAVTGRSWRAAVSFDCLPFSGVIVPGC